MYIYPSNSGDGHGEICFKLFVKHKGVENKRTGVYVYFQKVVISTTRWAITTKSHAPYRSMMNRSLIRTHACRTTYWINA